MELRHGKDRAAYIKGANTALAKLEEGREKGVVPLLAIDAWEHAFYLQYENRKAEFIDAIWNVVNWPHVDAHLAYARSARS